MADELLTGLIKLTPEVKQRLVDNQGKLKEVEIALESLKRMGMDTSKLDEQLQYGKDVAAELLKTFG